MFSYGKLKLDTKISPSYRPLTLLEIVVFQYEGLFLLNKLTGIFFGQIFTSTKNIKQNVKYRF